MRRGTKIFSDASVARRATTSEVDSGRRGKALRVYAVPTHGLRILSAGINRAECSSLSWPVGANSASGNPAARVVFHSRENDNGSQSHDACDFPYTEQANAEFMNMRLRSHRARQESCSGGA